MIVCSILTRKPSQLTVLKFNHAFFIKKLDLVLLTGRKSSDELEIVRENDRFFYVLQGQPSRRICPTRDQRTRVFYRLTRGRHFQVSLWLNKFGTVSNVRADNEVEITR